MTALGLGGLGRRPITVSVSRTSTRPRWPGVGGPSSDGAPPEGRRSPSRPSGSRWCPFDGLAS